MQLTYIIGVIMQYIALVALVVLLNENSKGEEKGTMSV